MKEDKGRAAMMKPHAMMIAALTVCAAPAHAEPLWRDIEAGMAAEEVRALYPLNPGEGRKVEHHQRKTELHGFMTIGKCKPRVEIMDPQGTVTGIQFWMRDQGAFKPNCTEEARLALFEKFGPPDMDNTRRPIAPFYANKAPESLTWIRPGITVEWLGPGKYKLVAWLIEYRAAPSGAASEL
ncbi:MAG: hypothetical protein ACK4IB_11755 [Erythrobacter sp.]